MRFEPHVRERRELVHPGPMTESHRLVAGICNAMYRRIIKVYFRPIKESGDFDMLATAHTRKTVYLARLRPSYRDRRRPGLGKFLRESFEVQQPNPSSVSLMKAICALSLCVCGCVYQGT